MTTTTGETVREKTLPEMVVDAVLHNDYTTTTDTTNTTTRKKQAPKMPTPPVEPQPRPNGQQYYPRPLQTGYQHPATPTNPDTETEQLTDITLLRKSRGNTVRENLYILLTGPPGTGKTALTEAAFPNLITLEGDGDTTVDDFIGHWVQNPDGTYGWVDGPLIEAAVNGLPFFIDEIALIPPPVLAALYPTMDGRATITVKTNPRRGTITIKNGYTVIGACNPDAPGSVMSEALLSRFTIHLETTTDYELAKKLGVHRKMVTAAKNLATKKNNNEITWAPQMRELLGFRDATERYNLTIAAANLIGTAPTDDQPIIADIISRTFGAAIPPLRHA